MFVNFLWGCTIFVNACFILIAGVRSMCGITVVSTKSDSDIIFSLQLLLSQILTCTSHLRLHESIDHLCINTFLRIGLIHK